MFLVRCDVDTEAEAALVAADLALAAFAEPSAFAWQTINASNTILHTVDMLSI